MSEKQYAAVCHAAESDYVTVVSGGTIRVQNGTALMMEIPCADAETACYNGALRYTCRGSNQLFTKTSPEAAPSCMDFREFDAVWIAGAVTNHPAWLVLQTEKGGKTGYIVYDTERENPVLELPIASDFIALSVTSEKTALLLCEEEKEAVPEDPDDEDYQVLFCREFSFRPGSEDARPLRQAMLYAGYNNFDDKYSNKLFYEGGMKLPLFDWGLKSWLIPKAMTSGGKYAVYYSPDFSGLIVADFRTGIVHRIFALPEGLQDESARYFYNDRTDRLICAGKDGLTFCQIHPASVEAIWRLDDLYEKACREKKWIQNQMEYQAALYDAIHGTRCEILP